MITIRRSSDRGHADHGWLDTFHTFSFGGYRDPDFTQFSMLRVLNQDRVAAGMGFGTHGHDNMEIVSVVLDGVLEHKDSMGNGARMHAGEVQLMSAGSGVTHSEFNGSKTDGLHFLQMWVIPAERDTTPRYGQRLFSDAERAGTFRAAVVPEGHAALGDDAILIGQDAVMKLARLTPDGDGGAESAATATTDLAPGRCAWLHVARGSIRLNGEFLAAGDGAGIRDEGTITAEIDGDEPADLVLWDLPA